MNDEKIALFKVKITKNEDADGAWVSVEWTPESGEYEDVNNFILPLEYALDVPDTGSWLMPPYARDWSIDLDLPKQPETEEDRKRRTSHAEAVNAAVMQLFESMESSEEDIQE